MKIAPNRVVIILVVFFLQQTSVFAAPEPPPPSSPPPPPPLPLDEWIVLLVVISILFGIYKLNKILNTKKASN